MTEDKKNSPIKRTESELKHFAKIYRYPSGLMDIIASSSPDFGPKGWETHENFGIPGKKPPTEEQKERKSSDPKGEDLERSMRRARAKLRRLALSNEFKWFVTLTLDPQRVDSHDGKAVVKKLNAWASNMVQRRGLRYILVPERHKKGGIHFHGFFNDVLEASPSGHMDRQGHQIYNFPQWSLGFTAGIELYDDYHKAVGYVCKYVGKQGEKPAGRWYYSGGDLKEPETIYADLSPAQLTEQFGERAYQMDVPGRKLAIANGIECT